MNKNKKMGVLARMKNNINVIFERDPAPKSKLEVILNYPGLHAIWMHRIAHFFTKPTFFNRPTHISVHPFPDTN